MRAELEVGRRRASEAEQRAETRAKDAENEADRRIAQIEEELRNAETIRRKLHNQVQELKGLQFVWRNGDTVDGQAGNIRVFARVRPALRVSPFASLWSSC